MPNNEKTYPHYFRQLPKFTTHVDVYMVLRLFGVTDPCVAHAIKKLLCAGQRGAKDRTKDLQEAVASVQRSLEIDAEEDESAAPGNNIDLEPSGDFGKFWGVFRRGTGIRSTDFPGNYSSKELAEHDAYHVSGGDIGAMKDYYFVKQIP